MDNDLLNWMKQNNIPINRENYLEADYLGHPEEHGPEQEAELPAKIRYEKVPEKEKSKQ
jgi:hypothetical protein